MLAGKPLVWWVLDALENSKVDKIIVALDKEYIDLVESFSFSKLEIYLRDLNNSQDTSSTEDVLLEVINNLNLKDDIMLVQATSPLTSYKDFNGAIDFYKNYDSVLSVVKQKRFIWDNKGNSLNYRNFFKNKNRLSGNIGCYEMNEKTYYEIDSEDDWKIIENLIK